MASQYLQNYVQFTRRNQVLTQSSSLLQYRPRTINEKKAIPHGQRKLLITMVNFLNLFWDPIKVPNPILIYVGAAPGYNIRLLKILFPRITFHCYDPRPFGINQEEGIILHQELFTDDTATQWTNSLNVILFIDIRSEDYKTMSKEDLEAAIWTDHITQRKWLNMIKPIAASLKFRLPYPDIWETMLKEGSKWREQIEIPYPDKLNIVRYPRGFVFLQPWAPPSSTETRLVPIPNEKGEYEDVDWDIITYERRLFYHNIVERENTLYLNPITNDNTMTDSPNLLSDYDSISETFIWKEYLIKHHITPTLALIIGLSRLSTIEINRGRDPKKVKTLASIRERAAQLVQGSKPPIVPGIPYRSRIKRV